CRDLLVRHGGHAAAAGFTVRNDRLPELKERLQAIAEAELSGMDLVPRLDIDAEVRLSDLDWATYGQLELMEPCGHENEQPVLMARGLEVRHRRAVGAEGRHLKLIVSDGRVVFDAIAFQRGDLAGQVPDRVDLAFTLNANEWNGERRLELNVLDLRPAGREEV
ncbi:MAG: single-stranded-DNA-specific exonuclease RecJ, partial [Anaerolineae bacterium]|nr:single-stranded-DNA-specific exonuclease RecJ [Anaerolineae bacterium]